MRKQLPIDGEKRIVRRFALLPIKCNSQEWAWLEWVKIEQMYANTQYHHNEWFNLQFVK